MRRFTFVCASVLMVTVSAASGQYFGSQGTDPATSLKTGNYVAFGPSIVPYYQSSVRLGAPAGCVMSPGLCNQLALGSSDAQWWGLRLDASFNLHLDRQADSGWAEGFLF